MTNSFGVKLMSEIQRSEQVLLSKAKDAQLDELRYQSGYLDGLRAAWQAYTSEEEKNGKKS